MCRVHLYTGVDALNIVWMVNVTSPTYFKDLSGSSTRSDSSREVADSTLATGHAEFSISAQFWSGVRLQVVCYYPTSFRAKGLTDRLAVETIRGSYFLQIRTKTSSTASSLTIK